MTSNLWKLREWLNLDEAADYLSSETGVDVDEDDILRLGLDGKLQLSVNLLKPMTAIQDCEGAESEKVEGVWDLLLKGPVRPELETRYRARCGLPNVKLDTHVEVFDIPVAYVTGKDGVVYQLFPSFDRSFDVGSLLVVRPQALDTVAASLASPSLGPEEQQPSKPGDTMDPLDKPLEQRERATLLTIIAALARAANIDISKASKAGEVIEAQTIGLRARVSARTIENHLKRIPDALERRGKISN